MSHTHRHTIMPAKSWPSFLARYCPRCTPRWRTYPKTMEDEHLARRRWRSEKVTEPVSGIGGTA